jgi:hypothetical protein
VERVHQLRRHDANDAAVPAGAGHDNDGARAHLEVGLDDLLRLRDDLGFLLLAAQVLGVEQRGQLLRFAGHRLVGGEQEPAAMSGELIRPAAFTRGARTKPMW